MTTNLAPIGRFYLIECPHRDGSYMSESDHLPRGKDQTVKDGLAALRQHDEALAIFECIPNEGYMRDVSEDMARAWLAEFDGERDDVPKFIYVQLGDGEIDAHYADLAAQRAHERDLASPEYTGRI